MLVTSVFLDKPSYFSLIAEYAPTSDPPVRYSAGLYVHIYIYIYTYIYFLFLSTSCMILPYLPVRPSVHDTVTQTLRIRGDAEGEWGFLYRSTLGSLMSGLSEAMEVR